MEHRANDVLAKLEVKKKALQAEISMLLHSVKDGVIPGGQILPALTTPGSHREDNVLAQIQASQSDRSRKGIETLQEARQLSGLPLR